MHVILNSTSYLSKYMRVSLLLRWGFWLVAINYLPVCLIALSYLQHYTIQSFMVYSYYFVTIFAHFALLLTISYVLIVVPICIVFKDDSFVRMTIATCYTLVVAALILDQATFNTFGFHLNIHVLQALVYAHIDYQNSFISLYFLLIPWILIIELIVGSIIWRRIFKLPVRSSKVYVALFVIIIFVIWSNLLYLYAHNTHIYDILKYRHILPLMFYSY